MVEFTVPGLHGKDRPRITHTGHAYTPRGTRDFEEMGQWHFRRAVHGHIVPLEGPVSVTIKAYHPIPRSAPKYKQQAMLSGELVPLTKPDADNVLKLVLDALNGLAYLDDKQVTHLRYQKRYALEAAVYVRVEEAGLEAVRPGRPAKEETV